jgi:hypothetical protein
MFVIYETFNGLLHKRIYSSARSVGDALKLFVKLGVQ